MKELVTVKEFDNPTDLYVSKSFLESEGIICFVKGEVINQMSPYPANLLNGIKLQVFSDQFDDAVKLLIRGSFAKEEDFQIPKDIERVTDAIKWLKKWIPSGFGLLKR